jgi:adenylylsulfate reductase subunit B
MAIQSIDKNKCIGCGRCRLICAMDVIGMGEDNKAFIKYPTECIVCLYCEQDCPVGAIYVSPEKMVKQLQAWG